MRSSAKKCIWLHVLLLTAFNLIQNGCGAEQSGDETATESQGVKYEQIRTKNGLSFVYPSSWYASDNTLKESLVALSNQPFIEGRDNSTAIFQAHFTTSPETANFMVRASKLNPTESIPELVPMINQNKVEFGKSVEEWMRGTLSATGFELIKFHGVRTLSIDGNPAFLIDFERTGPKGIVRVYNLKVENKNIRYGINFGFLVSEADTWEEVIEHMLNSLAFE